MSGLMLILTGFDYKHVPGARHYGNKTGHLAVFNTVTNTQPLYINRVDCQALSQAVLDLHKEKAGLDNRAPSGERITINPQMKATFGGLSADELYLQHEHFAAAASALRTKEDLDYERSEKPEATILPKPTESNSSPFFALIRGISPAS